MSEEKTWEQYLITDDRRLGCLGHEKNEILNMVLQNITTGVGLFELSTSVRALYLNEAYFACVGYKVEEYGSRAENILSTILEEDVNGFVSCMMEHIPIQKTFQYKVRCRRGDGCLGYLEIKGIPFEKKMNGNQVFLAVIWDVGAQMEREKQLRELGDVHVKLLVQEERYRILKATTQALLFEYDLLEDRMIFSYNFPNNHKRKVIPDYSDYQKKYSFVHSSHQEAFQAALREACQKETEGTLEYLSSVSGGGYRWKRTYYKSVPGPDGKIASVLGRIEDIHNMRMEQELLSQKADTDALTGLYRKEAAFEKMQEYIREAPARNYHFTIVDLDGFKQINDRYGHQEGDRILRETAEELSKAFEENSVIGRFGGDEFIILTRDISLQDIRRLLKKMEKKVAFCAGTVEWKQERAFEDVFEEADRKMYQMKRQQKGKSSGNEEI